MLAATHAAFSTALYLGGAAVFEYQTDPVSWGLGYAILADAGHRPADIEGRTAAVLYLGTAGKTFRPPHDYPFLYRRCHPGVIGFTAVFHLSAVLLVGYRRLLVTSSNRHGEYPGRGFVLAVADPRGDAWQDQIPAGGRQQGGNDCVVLDAGVLRRAYIR